MNILLLNYNNPFQESGLVVLDLFERLRQKGHNVKVLVNTFDAKYPEGIISMETRLSSLRRIFFEKLKYHLKINRSFGIRTDPKYRIFELNEQREFYKTDRLMKKAGFLPQVIIIFFAKNFINVKNINEFQVMTKSSVFWVMFDMAPFTGGCHYAWHCEGYKNNCGSCPGLFSNDPFDITYQNLIFKKKIIDKTNIQIIAGSEWQYRQARESTLFKTKPVHKILISVDPSIFRPVNKLEIRSKSKIPSNKKVIFFGALGLDSERKGMKYLLESLTILKSQVQSLPQIKENIFLLIAGSGFERIRDFLPFEFLNLGLLDNTKGIASAYQAADIFICPSVEDSGPTMINQSLMCGTPVVAFEMGVALDLVVTGETGYLAKIKDSKDLAQGIYNILILNDTDYKKLSENCRKMALRLCSPEVQIMKFENIIQSATSE